MDEIWIHQYTLESKQRYYHFLWFLKCFERQKLVHVLHISFLYECPTINFLYHCGFLDKVKFTYRQKWRDVIILHDNTILHTVLQTYKKTRRFILDSNRTSSLQLGVMWLSYVRPPEGGNGGHRIDNDSAVDTFARSWLEALLCLFIYFTNIVWTEIQL